MNKNNYLGSWLKEYGSCILIILTIIGFVSKSLYNYPMGIMALIGLYRLISKPQLVWADEKQKLFVSVFLCLWLPLLISFPDAINQSRSAQTVFPYLRFLFAGLFIVQELSKNKERLIFIILSIYIIVLFWCLDALGQFIFGQNLFGYPYRAGDITGMFYPRNRIAHICAILSSFCFIYVYINKTKRKWLWITLTPIFFIVLLSGRRAAWIMLFLSSFGFFIYLFLISKNKKYLLKTFGIITVFISIILTSTIFFHKPTNDRFITTLGLFSNDYETIDIATARRLPLWEAAYTIFKHNPFNGIGPRGFRYGFHAYATPDNYWYKKQAQTHPHLLFLEILAETGIIGIIGYLLFIYLILKTFFTMKNRDENILILLSVLIAAFPLNAHMAFYGSIWSSMLWWLIAVYFSSIRLKSNENTNH